MVSQPAEARAAAESPLCLHDPGRREAHLRAVHPDAQPRQRQGGGIAACGLVAEDLGVSRRSSRKTTSSRSPCSILRPAGSREKVHRALFRRRLRGSSPRWMTIAKCHCSKSDRRRRPLFHPRQAECSQPLRGRKRPVATVRAGTHGRVRVPEFTRLNKEFYASLGDKRALSCRTPRT